MDGSSINHLAVLVAALSAFMVGGLWYSPLLFYRAWMKANHFSEEDLKKGHPGVIYGLALVFCLIIAYNLAFFLNDADTTWQWGLTAGLLAGVGWAATAMGVIALFERRPFSYFWVNGGYIALHFALNGFIIGIWR